MDFRNPAKTTHGRNGRDQLGENKEEGMELGERKKKGKKAEETIRITSGGKCG